MTVPQLKIEPVLESENVGGTNLTTKFGSGIQISSLFVQTNLHNT